MTRRLIMRKQQHIAGGEVAKNNNSHTVAPGASRAGAQAIPAYDWIMYGACLRCGFFGAGLDKHECKPGQ
jgi:hypothetical protein